MTLDTSALIAVLFSEPGYLDLVDAMLEVLLALMVDSMVPMLYTKSCVRG